MQEFCSQPYCPRFFGGSETANIEYFHPTGLHTIITGRWALSYPDSCGDPKSRDLLGLQRVLQEGVRSVSGKFYSLDASRCLGRLPPRGSGRQLSKNPVERCRAM